MVEPESNESRKSQAPHPNLSRVDSEPAATNLLNGGIRRQVQQNASDAQQLRSEVEQYRQTLGLGIGEQQASRQHSRQHQPTPQRSQRPHKSADLDIER